MANRQCAICLCGGLDSDAPILTMSGYATPRVLCDECAKKLDIITSGEDCQQIADAIKEITTKLANGNIDDPAALSAVTEIVNEGSERAKRIKEGTWDFSLDEESTDELVDIPEELEETEEDIELDRREKERNDKFDKFLNWVWIGVGIGAAGFIVWRIIQMFL